MKMSFTAPYHWEMSEKREDISIAFFKIQLNFLF